MLGDLARRSSWSKAASRCLAWDVAQRSQGHGNPAMPSNSEKKRIGRFCWEDLFQKSLCQVYVLFSSVFYWFMLSEAKRDADRVLKALRIRPQLRLPGRSRSTQRLFDSLATCASSSINLKLKHMSRYMQALCTKRHLKHLQTTDRWGCCRI